MKLNRVRMKYKFNFFHYLSNSLMFRIKYSTLLPVDLPFYVKVLMV